jgi:thiamine-phosphate pyrophosphorylase
MPNGSERRKGVNSIGRLHILTDTVLQTRFSHVELARLAVEGGADIVQFREKQGSTRHLIQSATEMKKICERHNASFIVNDRIDVAIASKAHGVHLGQSDFPIGPAREILGEEKIIGGSASTIEEALLCMKEGADYVGFGPVYETTSKDDAGPVSGLVKLKEVAAAVSIPVIAIGGISAENAADVMKADAYGIAVISSVCCQEDPKEATHRLVDIIKDSLRNK